MSSVWTIRRSTSDVKLAGLCGGIARQWGVDPLLVRVGFAMLALSGGVGVILYLAGWLLLPTDGRDTAPVDDLFGAATHKWPREVWIAIVTIACVAAFVLFGSLTPFGIGPALILAVIWYFGFYRPRAAERDEPPRGTAAGIQPAAPPAPFSYPGPPTPFTEAAEAWQRRMAEYQRQQVPPSGQPAGRGLLRRRPTSPASAASTSRSDRGPIPADPEQLKRAAFLATPDPVGLYSEPVAKNTAGSVVRPVRRLSARRLGWATLLVLGLTLTGLGVADSLGAAITPTVYAAAALLVVGLALVLATWLGRARGLLPMGVVLTLAVLGLSAAGPGLHGLPPLGRPGHPDRLHHAGRPAGGRRPPGRRQADRRPEPAADHALTRRTRPGSISAPWT